MISFYYHDHKEVPKCVNTDQSLIFSIFNIDVDCEHGMIYHVLSFSIYVEFVDCGQYSIISL